MMNSRWDDPLSHVARFEVKALAKRQFVGLASTWDLDHGGDLITPGAFSRTLDEWKASGRTIPLINQHNYHDARHAIGKMLDAQETAAGLEATFSIVTSAEGDEFLARVKEGIIDGLSIGYAVRDGRQPNDAERKLGVQRVLTDIDLREVSLVIWGMNAGALIDTASVKAAISKIDDPGELRALASHIGSKLRANASPAPSADTQKHQATTEPDSAAIRRADTLRQLTIRTITGAL